MSARSAESITTTRRTSRASPGISVDKRRLPASKMGKYLLNKFTAKDGISAVLWEYGLILKS
jgi:hypothetical protein